MSRHPGSQFLQIPGPTNLPERVRAALARPLIDHRGPEFAALAREAIAGLKEIVNTTQPIAVYPSSGTGAWEAALVNVLTPGDEVLLCDNGFFAHTWGQLAENLGFRVRPIAGEWRRPPDPEQLQSVLAADRAAAVKAVLVVHNETSTGVVANVPEIRRAIDDANHPALLLVDTISSLGSMPYDHDSWRIDVTIAASQKGLMLPPGLGINAVSERARAQAQQTTNGVGYWSWEPYLTSNDTAHFPYTASATLFFALHEALRLIEEEGLENVFARHERHGQATREAVHAWGLEVYGADPTAHSPALTAVLLPEGCDARDVRRLALERWNLVLGAGLGALAQSVFRIGHLADFNDLMLCGTLSGVELSLLAAEAPIRAGGVTAALRFL